jgi:hypothetical protein
MRKNANEIQNVEKEEATILLDVLEILIEQTYIKKHQRQEKMEKLQAIVKSKKE